VWRLAAALSAAITPHDVALALAEWGAPVADATFSNLAVLDAPAKRVRVAHRSDIDPVIAARWSEFDLSEPTPLCEAMESGRAVLIHSPEDMAARYPNMLADTLAASLNATASLPLATADGVILGAAGFGWPTPQGFESAQLHGLTRVADLAA